MQSCPHGEAASGAAGWRTRMSLVSTPSVLFSNMIGRGTCAPHASTCGRAANGERSL